MRGCAASCQVSGRSEPPHCNAVCMRRRVPSNDWPVCGGRSCRVSAGAPEGEYGTTVSAHGAHSRRRLPLVFTRAYGQPVRGSTELDTHARLPSLQPDAWCCLLNLYELAPCLVGRSGCVGLIEGNLLTRTTSRAISRSSIRWGLQFEHIPSLESAIVRGTFTCKRISRQSRVLRYLPGEGRSTQHQGPCPLQYEYLELMFTRILPSERISTCNTR